MNRPVAPLALVGLVAFALSLGCPGTKPPVAGRAGGGAGGQKVTSFKMSRSGEGFRLSNAEDDEAVERPPVATSSALSVADTQKVLARLPPLVAGVDDDQDFALRDKSMPAPRTGKTLEGTFPPPGGGPPPVTPAAGALTVVRHSPEGNIELAPFLSVTFSQPLVGVTSHAELAKLTPPVKLTPQPPGEWRWLGAQTVVFQPEKRFPMATDFSVEIPAGTKAASGAVLAAAERWTFSTPTPTLVLKVPEGGPYDLEPIVFCDFDQQIDPQAVLASIKLSAGDVSIPLRMATESEVESDKLVRPLAAKAQPKRWLAFRAEGKLAPATSYTVRVGPGTPSAEGPKKTTSEQIFGFRTYGPLRVDAATCGWSGSCVPLMPWSVPMSNPIDPKKFDKSMVHVSPDLAAMKVSTVGNLITIQGRSKGRTHYTIKVSGAIGDTFRQTMGRDAETAVDVGPAGPNLFREQAEMSVLDPAGTATLPVYSVNEPQLRVRLYAVRPEDWIAYQKFRASWDQEAKETTPPGRLVQNTVIATHGAPDELTETLVPLKPALGNTNLGQVIAIVEPTHPTRKDWGRQWVRSWVQVTKLGLDAFIDQDQIVGWATALGTGAPLADVEVGVVKGSSAKSGPDGLARIELTGPPGDLLYAKQGADTVILPERYGSIGGLRRVDVTSDFSQWLVFDDRHMYRPGEEPRVKGWVRRQGQRRGGDLGMTPDLGKQLTWTVQDSRGAEVTKGKTELDDAGGFDFTFKVPTNVNLGQAQVQLRIDGSTLANFVHYHALSFEEFRRPEFEVTAQTTSGPHVVGDHAVATVSATYYAGGGLPNADVNWTVRGTPGHFTPPNRSEYAFGPEGPVYGYGRMTRGGEAPQAETWTAKTSSAGAHRLRIDFDALEKPGPMSIQLDASVTDVNRQAWSAHASLLVHPADVYVGLKRPRGFVRAGEALAIDAIVTDLDGKLVAGQKVTVKSARLDWEQEGTDWVEKERDVESCAVESKADAVPCSLKTKDGGSYRVSATVTDSIGRRSVTEMRVWVLSDRMPPSRELAAGTVKLVTDKEQYQPGDTAEVLVLAPFAPAEGVLSIRRQGIVKLERFTMKTSAQTISVKIEREWLPGAALRVDLVGAETRTNDAGEPDAALPQKPAFAAGATRLTIPPKERTITLVVQPRDKAIEPGGSTIIDVDAKDAQGRPAAGTQLALVVVDEAVLALSGYELPDPLSVFYTQRPDYTREIALRDRVLVAKPPETTASITVESNHLRILGGAGRAREATKSGPASVVTATAAPEAPAPPAASAAARQDRFADDLSDRAQKDEKEDKSSTPMALRTDFAALAAFVPKVTTDAAGRAAVPVKLPDSLTRYRVMAVAVQGENRFGHGEATVTARLPLMVRPSPPRFLNFGDKFEMPIVVQNQTDTPMEVDVAMRAVNATVSGTGRRVTVPANDRVEVRIAAAAAKAGTARFQIGAAAGRFSDANQLELVVWTPATTEAFATYGTIDDGAIAQPVKMPADVVPQFGGLEITTSSTALQALTDAVLYLVHYPFECNEQISSRVVSIAALKDVLGAFKTKEMPTPEALLESEKKDIDRLKSRQSWSGGWGFWPGADPHPYVSVHVAHALVRAKDKGFDVDPQVLARSLGYLRIIEAQIPTWWPEDVRRSLIAYALNVRWRMKDVDISRAKRLVAEAGGADKLPLEALGWILPIVADDPSAAGELAQIRKHLANRVTETAGAAHFDGSYKDSDYLILNSDRRADGVLLEALIGDQPQSDVIPKIVTGLLAHRKAGHWANTQENAFVLLALDRYFSTYEKTTPDFIARAWLGDKYAGEHAFKGRTTERYQVNVPMRQLADFPKGANLTLQKDGPGRMYYRIGMQYAPSDLRPPPIDRGFTVTRKYESIDDPKDVRQDESGVWHVKSGAKVRVRVGMVAPSRRYHVALVDPLPAGFEPMNPALAVSGPIPQDPKETKSPFWWWRGTWYEHQNLRDERVEAFASLLWEGVYDYTYVARATTPGDFVVAPPKAEEMYMPETFGRGAGDRVIIE
jgi:alpha-2-macroglobulin